MIRYGSTAHWFARRVWYSLCAAALAGLAVGGLCEAGGYVVERRISDVPTVDPNRPLPGWITDQYRP